MSKLKWTVEFEVSPTWVEDGFDLTDEDALDMLAHRLPWANIGLELNARVVARPDAAAVANLTGETVAAVEHHRKAGAL